MASKQLLLLRHAKSDWDSAAASDFARPLNQRGRRDAPKMGQWLAENGGVPECIVASPAARTTETVELVCAASAVKMVAASDRVSYDRRLYHASREQICEIAAEQLEGVQRLLIVAHNPGMELALRWYCPAAAPFADGKLMPTCALAVIDIKDSAAGAGKLRALLRPSDL